MLEGKQLWGERCVRDLCGREVDAGRVDERGGNG